MRLCCEPLERSVKLGRPRTTLLSGSCDQTYWKPQRLRHKEAEIVFSPMAG